MDTVMTISTWVNSTPRRNLPPAANGQKTTQINKETQQIKSSVSTEKSSVGNAQIATFCSTQHAQRSQGFQGSLVTKDKCLLNERHHEIIFTKAEMKHTSQKITRLNTESKSASHNKSLATHDTSHQSTGNSSMIHTENNLVREDKISVLNNLKDLLNATNLEKAEIASEYEKWAIICQTQRREIHELKQALSAATASPPLTRDSSKHQIFPASLQSTTSSRISNRRSPQHRNRGGGGGICEYPVSASEFQGYAERMFQQLHLKQGSVRAWSIIIYVTIGRRRGSRGNSQSACLEESSRSVIRFSSRSISIRNMGDTQDFMDALQGFITSVEALLKEVEKRHQNDTASITIKLNKLTAAFPAERHGNIPQWEFCCSFPEKLSKQNLGLQFVWPIDVDAGNKCPSKLSPLLQHKEKFDPNILELEQAMLASTLGGRRKREGKLVLWFDSSTECGTDPGGEGRGSA
ncbi:hypothetical protein KSP40_PGU009165 [Platanthera guangdongensis]|uniref:Uncharacterized protein n=1 Tax=Platanthera guangdongensis TaxID=2320717 RepID=A0ABR2MXL5_9ASPA